VLQNEGLNIEYNQLGVVRKRRPQSGGGSLCSADKEEVLHMRTSTFLVQKISDFDICGVSAQTRGLSQCGQGGRGQFFCDFVRTSFMDGPLDILVDYIILIIYGKQCLNKIQIH